MTPSVDADTHVKPKNTAEAIFAGGCFWCIESDLEKLEGVSAVVSGYTGGTVANPTYKQVVTGTTGHREAVRVVYDPSVVSYKQLLDAFWVGIDPFDEKGQFCDKGFQYTAAIYTKTDAEREAAKASKKAMSKKLGKPVVTAIEDAAPFYDAEEYHQDYYKKNPIRYRYYRFGCGRDKRTEEVWGK